MTDRKKACRDIPESLIDKVNANASDGNGSENMNAKQYQSNLRQMAIIIAVLAALCVMLVMAVINIVLKQSKRKNVRTRDELDF